MRRSGSDMRYGYTAGQDNRTKALFVSGVSCLRCPDNRERNGLSGRPIGAQRETLRMNDKMPPPHEWVARENGLMRWTPTAEWLQVLPDVEGRRHLMVRIGDREHEVRLSAEQAQHLAALLVK